MFAIARQAEGYSAPHDLAQPSVAHRASPYAPSDSAMYSGFELLARNNEFAVQPSNSPMGRTK
jgi:hypothetical protein